MIGFSKCHYYFSDKSDHNIILFDADLQFELTDRICILVHSGQGKSTILQLLRGLEEPTAGEVYSHQGLSWPIGSSGAFHPELSGEDNVRVLSMLRGLDPDWISAYTLVFSELGDDYFRPMKTYSSGKRARLAFSLSYAVPTEMYLVEDTIGSGTADFSQRCRAALSQRLQKSGLFMVTRNPRLGEQLADRFYVLENGKFIACGNYGEAKERFEEIGTETDELLGLLKSFDEIE